jgi:hypothetical protein
LAGLEETSCLAGTGSDVINGGLGYDRALQEGAKSDYSLVVSNGAITLTNKTSGSIDTLIDISQIEFDNGDVLCIINSFQRLRDF